jgi:hypothetical protein
MVTPQAPPGRIARLPLWLGFRRPFRFNPSEGRGDGLLRLEPIGNHFERRTQTGGTLKGTGTLTVRPIETEIFSTSIDVGIGTNNDGTTKPADRSLIFDIPSNSWHDEP